MSEEAFIIPIIVLSFFACLGYWIHIRDRRARERLQTQMDLQTKILARFDSAQDFAGFLQTDGGRTFLSGLAEPPAVRRPTQRILTAVQLGIVVTMFGVGLCLIGWIERSTDPFLPGVVFLCIGAGFLIGAAVSYHLSKSWGLLGEPAVRRTDLLGDLSG